MPAPLKSADPSASVETLRQLLAFNLRTLRVARGLSQEQLGLSANLDRTFVSQIERAKLNVSLDSLERLSIALDVDASALLLRP